ncbi:hypothetical protein BTO30_09525 [Domibacillus antri]|uniref:Lipoprotein n=1 Tax=Domibacillus antri TaxID=1714264 RepID=A0A1Q8Q5A7_9BACI|nr:hypothetical protein [Domibacillus antri]OLN22534.1 hypothetical protein BTO30_09525 [Domibacillus antri]
MKKAAIPVLALVLPAILTGCQEAGDAGMKNGDAQISQVPKQERKIISELEQTTDDTALRDAAYEKVLKSDILKGGYLGENTPALQEDMGVQMIEFEVVQQAVTDVFGSISGYGIMFLGNPSDDRTSLAFGLVLKNRMKKWMNLSICCRSRWTKGKFWRSTFIFIKAILLSRKTMI